jgi:hypothetical protein
MVVVEFKKVCNFIICFSIFAKWQYCYGTDTLCGFQFKDDFYWTSRSGAVKLGSEMDHSVAYTMYVKDCFSAKNLKYGNCGEI